MNIAKAPIGFIEDGDIFDGATCSGLSLSSGNYEEGMQDITILPGRAKQMGAPVTHEEQCALRSELENLIRIGRIPTPDALYDASILAQTFAAEAQAILNPINFDEFIDVNIATGNLDISARERIWGLLANRSKDVHIVNLLEEIKDR